MQPRGKAVSCQQSQREKLLKTARGHVNDVPVSSMMASWLKGEACVANWLGLDSLTFRKLVRFQFPGYSLRITRPARRTVDVERAVEWDDLKRFLIKNRAHKCSSELWIAEIIASACMGSNHLWQDLGLENRKELSDLMENNFPRMAKRNTMNMKWKKFIYRELCHTEGIYVCRAPSCDVCKDYDDCFGSEE